MSDKSGRQYPVRPVLGVGALLYQGNRILLVERGQPPLAGYWSLPGGAVESGERLEDALRREVWEETGLRVEPGTIATVFERIMPDAENRCEYHYVLVDFYCTVVSGQLRAGDDSSDARWIELADLPTVRLTEGTREVILTCKQHRSTHPVVMRP